MAVSAYIRVYITVVVLYKVAIHGRRIGNLRSSIIITRFLAGIYARYISPCSSRKLNLRSKCFVRNCLDGLDSCQLGLSSLYVQTWLILVDTVRYIYMKMLCSSNEYVLHGASIFFSFSCPFSAIRRFRAVAFRFRIPHLIISFLS